MADRAKIIVGSRFVSKPPEVKLQRGEKAGIDELQVINLKLQEIVTLLNGRVSLGDATQASNLGNLDGQWIEVYFPTADAAIEIPHGLLRRPVGIHVADIDKAAIIYSPNRGSWSSTVLVLASDTDATTALLEVF